MYLAGVRIVVLAVQFASIPFLIAWLGKAAFGAAQFAALFVGWAAMVDIGFGEGGLIYMMRAGADTQLDRWALWGTHFRLLLAHAFGGAVILAVIGLFWPVSKEVPHPSTLFACAGLFFFTQTVANTYTQFWTATQNFQRLSMQNLNGQFASVALSVSGVYFTRRPEAFLLGNALGLVFATLASSRAMRKMRPADVGAKPFSWAMAKDFLKIGFQSYPNRIFSLIMGTADRMLVGKRSTVALNDYNNSVRIGDGLNDLSTTIRQTYYADIAQSHVAGPDAVAKSVDRFSRLILGVGICAILVPSSFGAPILHLWLKDKAYAGGAFVLICRAIYCTMELYYSTFGIGMITAGKAKWLLPQIITNGLITLTLTLPLYGAFGLEGVGMMNVGIEIILFLPILLIFRKNITNSFPIGWHLTHVIPIILLGALLVGIGTTLGSVLVAHHAEWLSLLIMPIMVVVSALLLFATGLVPMTDGIRRLMAKTRIPMRSAQEWPGSGVA